MTLIRRWIARPVHWLPQLDPHSLQVRLTVGIALVSALGIGTLAIATSWQMQRQLVATHKQTIKYIFDRFDRDVMHYSERNPAEMGLQPAIDNLSAERVLLWVKRPDGAIAAQSMPLSGRADDTSKGLLGLPARQMMPQVSEIGGRFWVWCSGPLTVKGTHLGQLYIAADITQDRGILEGLIRTLALASGAAIAAMTVAIALYVRRSLRPVLEIGQLADRISVRELDTARIQLQNAPSEVRQLAQTCNTMLDRLAQSWEQQRQFVSNVSHELRTPLTLVSGYLQSTLRRATNLSEPQREALEIAASEAERTIQLLQDLLDLARADRGYLHFQLEPLLIGDLVAEVVEMAKQYSHREISIACGNDLLEATADRNRLKQVLLNLIDNAVKYSPSDTEIIVGVRALGDRAIVEICDRGVGIPLAQQGRIFEPFYRVDEARSRSVSPGESHATGGTGLGLSIVKTLVEGMGGTVTVRSKPGEGSTFGAILPRSP